MKLSIELPLVFLLGSLVYFLVLLVYKNARYYYLGSKIRGPGLLEVIYVASGSIENVTNKFKKSFKKWATADRDYNFIKIWLGPKLLIFSGKVEHISQLLNEHLSKAEFYTCLNKFGKESLLLQNEMTKYHHHRSFLTSTTLRHSTLKSYMDIFFQETKILADKLESFAKSGEAFEPIHIIAMANLAMIIRTVSGLDFKVQQTGYGTQYRSGADNMMKIFIYRVFKPWLRLDFLYWLSGLKRQEEEAEQQAENFFQDFLSKVKAKILADNTKRDAEVEMPFLEAVLRAQLDPNVPDLMSEEVLKKELNVLLSAGYDTTKTISTYLLIILAIHPEIQQEVYDEIDSVLGSDLDTPPSYAQIQQLHLLDRVIKETQRMFPSTSFVARELTRDVVVDDCTWPAGATVAVLLFGLHRDPVYWSHPDRFDPDRFLPAEVARRSKLAFMPFSAGPRMCPGYKYAILEIKVVVSSLLRRYRVLLGDKCKSLDDIKYEFGLTARPLPGLDLRIQPRKKNKLV